MTLLFGMFMYRGVTVPAICVDCVNDAWRGVLNVVALTVRLSALIARSTTVVNQPLKFESKDQKP